MTAPELTLSLIHNRRSIYDFSESPIEAEKLHQLWEALRWAPSCFNEQPWRLIMAQKASQPEKWEKILSCLVPKNQEWAQKAPVLMITMTRTTFTKNDKPNRHAWHDVGLAMGNLLQMATSLNLSVHQMAGFDSEKVVDQFSLEENLAPIAAVAIGYAGSEEEISGKDLLEVEANPKPRKPVAELFID